MALSNHERIGRALESARAGLLKYVTDEMERVYGPNWRQRARESLPGWQKTMGSELVLDIQRSSQSRSTRATMALPY